MRTRFLLLVALLYMTISFAQKIERVEPTFWWTDMQNKELQIMVYGENLAGLVPSIDYDGITLKETILVDNPNYLFLYLDIAEGTKAGKFPIYFKDGKKLKLTVDYTLREREPNARDLMGYTPADVICLVTPDRFVNGDSSNDTVEGMYEQVNREAEFGRHGGDIRGIINSLDYLKDLGYTAVWVNPVLENDQKVKSYHGYATTDFYKVDRRFGSNEEYRELADKAREKDMKIIMDMIMNHCGSQHWWMNDLPSFDWLSRVDGDKFVRTSHTRTNIRDPYVSDIEKRTFTDGWFSENMPDMNQKNPLVADYLIQNTLWWIEYLGLSGIRMDTYPYSDKDFMTRWTYAIIEEYPNFKTVGEEWSIDPSILAYWQAGGKNVDGYVSYLSGLLDFPLQDAVVKGLTGDNDRDISKILLTLSSDYLYGEPMDHVIFPDNHDMSRIFTQLGEDYDLYKMAMALYATMRGTPQIYYGTEILFANPGTESHGYIRADFPGGWEGDTVNAFTGEGLTAQQKDAQAFVKKLLNWRKTSKAVHEGKMKHFSSKKGLYIYFRYTDDDMIMVIMNRSEQEQIVESSYLEEILPIGASAIEVITDKEYKIGEELTIAPKTAMILDFE
ncbi:MAG: glycoside hydrolase family 13 protein [Bacteroidales bacterium]